MIPRIALTLLIVVCVGSSARSQQDNDARKGRQLAVDYCALCHVAAPDQPTPPVMRPPAPSFESIAQRQDTNENAMRTFLKTTHAGLDRPNGMPNPRLSDSELRQVIDYLLSLRNK